MDDKKDHDKGNLWSRIVIAGDVVIIIYVVIVIACVFIATHFPHGNSIVSKAIDMIANVEKDQMKLSGKGR